MPDKQAVLDEVEDIHNGLKSQPPHGPDQIFACKKVIEFYLYAFKYYMYDELRAIVAKNYVQHNNSVGDGPDSIIEFAERERKAGGGGPMDLTMQRILCDGEYIIAHVKGVMAGGVILNVIDMFRFKDNLFVEHWDVAAPVPPDSEWKNGNGAF